NNRDAKKFVSAAAKLNKGPFTAPDIKQNDFNIAAIGENRQLVRWIYDNGVGDVSDPFQMNDKYVVVLINSINKPGLKSGPAVRTEVEPLIRNEKKAQQIINAKIKGKTLEEIASAVGTFVQVADSISFQSYIIPNVGN